MDGQDLGNRSSSERDESLGQDKRNAGDRVLRLHQQVAHKIGTAILSGTFPPGCSLGGEIEQSEAFGVSRTAYREALRILIAKGLIESRPKAGTHVTPRERWNLLDPDVLAWTFSGKPDERFVHDLFELRGLIEPAAAGMAAERRTPEQIEQMRIALAAMRDDGLATPAGQAADQQFHKTIFAAAGNQALYTIASSIGAAVQWTTHYKQRAQLKPRDPLPEHILVFEAIVAQDTTRARAEMLKLLEFAMIDMEEAIG
jgi:DNA-binding FadR family transcriptional regulator